MIESQNDRIRAWLKKGHSITCLQAYKLFGCLALHSRISDIRKTEQIDDEWVSANGKHFKRCYMNIEELAL